MSNITRTVLVTGANSGIGQAVAKHLLGQGCTVIGAARHVTESDHDQQRYYPFVIDLADLQKLPDRLKLLESDYPKLDAAILCAGRGQFGSLEEFSFEQIEQLVSLNFTSQAFLARSILPTFKRQNHGDLIFIGSEAALHGSRKGAVYCATKFALRGFAQALRDECSNSRIRVSIINPGMVKTPFFERLSFHPGDESGQFIEAEDVASAVDYILNANPNIVIDEINLSPLNKVIRFKKNEE